MAVQQDHDDPRERLALAPEVPGQGERAGPRRDLVRDHDVRPLSPRHPDPPNAVLGLQELEPLAPRTRDPRHGEPGELPGMGIRGHEEDLHAPDSIRGPWLGTASRTSTAR